MSDSFIVREKPISDVADIKTDRIKLTDKFLDPEAKREEEIRAIERNIEDIQSQRTQLERQKNIINSYKSMCTPKRPDNIQHISVKI